MTHTIKYIWMDDLLANTLDIDWDSVSRGDAHLTVVTPKQIIEEIQSCDDCNVAEATAAIEEIQNLSDDVFIAFHG